MPTIPRTPARALGAGMGSFKREKIAPVMRPVARAFRMRVSM